MSGNQRHDGDPDGGSDILPRIKAGRQHLDQDQTEQADARRQQEEAWAKQRADAERWRTELRPRAVRLIAERTARLGWSPMLLRLLLEDIRPDELFLDVLGKPDRIAAKRYPQAIAVALALRHGWQRDDLVMFSKRLGVKVTSKDLAATPAPPTPDSEPPSAPTDRSRKSLKRA